MTVNSLTDDLEDPGLPSGHVWLTIISSRLPHSQTKSGNSTDRPLQPWRMLADQARLHHAGAREANRGAGRRKTMSCCWLTLYRIHQEHWPLPL